MKCLPLLLRVILRSAVIASYAHSAITLPGLKILIPCMKSFFIRSTANKGCTSLQKRKRGEQSGVRSSLSAGRFNHKGGKKRAKLKEKLEAKSILFDASSDRKKGGA